MVEFNYMYKKYYTYICSIVGKIIKDDGSDIAQAAFLKLSECTYADNEAIAKQFVKTTAIRMAISHLRARERKNKVITPLLPDYEASDEHQTREAELEELKKNLLRYIFKRILELPEGTRNVFELYYFKGLKAKQISKKLGITKNTVWSHLHHARITLRMDALFKKSAE